MTEPTVSKNWMKPIGRIHSTVFDNDTTRVGIGLRLQKFWYHTFLHSLYAHRVEKMKVPLFYYNH